MKAFYGDDVITPIEQQLKPKNSIGEKEGKVIKNKYTALLFGGIDSLLTIFLGYNEMHSGGTLGGLMILSFGGLCFVIVNIWFYPNQLKRKDRTIDACKSKCST
jgi:hypothetical protein